MIPRYQTILSFPFCWWPQWSWAWRCGSCASAPTSGCSRRGLGAHAGSRGGAGRAGYPHGGQRRRWLPAGPGAIPAAACRTRRPRARRAGQAAGPLRRSRCRSPRPRRRKLDAQVFLLPVPNVEVSGSQAGVNPAGQSSPSKDPPPEGPQLAVVNLTGSVCRQPPLGHSRPRRSPCCPSAARCTPTCPASRKVALSGGWPAARPLPATPT
jgi:hypothetical protein